MLSVKSENYTKQRVKEILYVGKKLNDSFTLNQYNSFVDEDKKQDYKLDCCTKISNCSEQFIMQLNSFDIYKAVENFMTFNAKPFIEHFIMFIGLSDEENSKEFYERLQLNNLHCDYNFVKNLLEYGENFGLQIDRERFCNQEVLGKEIKSLNEDETKNNLIDSLKSDMFSISSLLGDFDKLNRSGYEKYNEKLDLFSIDSDNLALFYFMTNVYSHNNLKFWTFVNNSDELFEFYLDLSLAIMLCTYYTLTGISLENDILNLK